MLLNTAFVKCAHYFIYLELSLWRYSDFEELAIVELAFDRKSLQF